MSIEASLSLLTPCTCGAGGCRSSSGPSPPVSLLPPACLVSWASPCAAATAIDQGHPPATADPRQGANGAVGRRGKPGLRAARRTAERRDPAEGLGDPGGPRHVRVRRAPGPDVCVRDFLLRGEQDAHRLVWTLGGRSAGGLLLLLLFATSQEEKTLPGEPVVSARALHACLHGSYGPSVPPSPARGCRW